MRYLTVAKYFLRRITAAGPQHAAAGMRGGAAEVEAADGSAVVGPAGDGAEGKKLVEGHGSLHDIAAREAEGPLQVAHERGFKQIDTRVMDGENVDLPDDSFDAVLCRLGLMYMPHPVTALREWRRALRAGGRVAVVVFSTPDRNSWGAMPISIIRRRAQLPPPVAGQPGPFSLGGPGVLEGVFRQAGFADPEVRAVPVPLRMASTAEYVRLAREAFGAFNAMMAHLPPEERESVWNEVEGSMRGFESPAGFEVPGECLVAAATKSVG